MTDLEREIAKLMLGLLKRLFWKREEVKPVEAAAEPARPFIPWKVGDEAVLYRENPYKGTLRTGRVYTVAPTSGSDNLYLLADNGTLGWFYGWHFVRAGDEHPSVSKTFTKKIGRAERMTRNRHNRLIAAEYDDIIRAQELLENPSEGNP